MAPPPIPPAGERSSFALSRRLFLSLVGGVYLAAFLSLGSQVLGLVGSAGILPAAELLERARAALGDDAWHRLPTVLWLDASDRALFATCAVGAAASVLAAVGAAPRVTLAIAWVAYLSLSSVGDVFLGYQWDALLLETGLLAVLFAPAGFAPEWRAQPPGAVLFLLRWLLFRLILLSGVVKLTSGDPTWRELTALEFHYWTQPLPHAGAHYAHHVGGHALSAIAMFAAELVAPLAALGPRPLRRAAALAIVALVAGIQATGNYGFFEVLTLALCVPLLDDAALRRLPGLRGARPALTTRPRGALRRVLGGALVAFVVAVTGAAGLRRAGVWTRPPEPLADLERALAPFRSFNAYGLFAVMTTTRPEIVVEGSRDGETWTPYPFRWKPGRVDRAPRFAGLHMPRLDWQMWFAALRGFERARWFPAFAARLLEGSPQVLDLLAEDPFGGRPPRFVRARLFAYRFGSAEERRAGTWWVRDPAGSFGPPLTLVAGRLRAASPAPAGSRRPGGG